MRTRSHSLEVIRRAFASVLALAAAIFLIGLFGSSNVAAAGNNDKVTLIVKMAPGLSENVHASTVAKNGGTEKGRVDKLSIKLIEVSANAADAILKKYQDDPNVTRAEKSKQRQTDRAPVDPLFGSQWALGKIGWTEVFGTMTPSGTATVAVLDTGINAAHPDLAGNVIAGTSILDGSSGMTDPNGHGTWVAGIVAARSDNGEGIAGVGFAGVRVMPVTVLNSDGLGDDADVVQGVVWAADNGANVILMAFSNPGFSESLQDAIDYAWGHGVVIVAAAGNDGWSTPSFPAGDRGVIGVAATDEQDLPAVFSNEGQSVFMAAPGTNIQTTDKVGYTTVSGTSSSAAYVAGAAALLKAFDPLASNGMIVGRLARNADPAGSTGDTGNGRLNLARALGDTSTESVQPAGADPVGSGGPFVGPYVIAANLQNITAGSQSGTLTHASAGTATFVVTYNMAGNANSITITPTVSGLPTGATGVFSPASFSATNSNTPPKTSTLTVTLAAGNTITAQNYALTFNSSTNAVSGGNVGTSTLTVGKATSTTTINTNLSGPTVTGQAYTVQATVSGAGTTPAGDLTISDGTSSCGPVALVAGVGSCSLPNLSTGNKTITASFSNGTNHLNSSATASHQVNAANTTTTITNAATLASTSTVVGQSYAVTFSVAANSPGGGTPTGSVTVSDGTNSCNALISVGSCSLPSTTPGPKSITATYAGDGSNYNGSSSAPPAPIHTVTLRATTTAVSCTPTSIPVGVATTCTATVTDSSPGTASTPGGTDTVTFSASGAGVSPTAPTCSPAGSGTVATCTATFTGSSVGTIQVSASYAGDASHNGSNTAGPFNVTVTARTTQTSVSCASPVLPNQASSCTVTVKDTDTAPQTTPSGSVTVTASGVGASPASQSCTPLSGSGNTSTCTVSISGTTGGTINVSASYPATGNHAASSATTTITVNSRTTSTAVSCTTPIGEGSTSTCTATVSDTNTGTPTTPSGTVNFANTGPVTSPTATCTLSGGTCSVVLTSNNPGTINVTASYVGNTLHSASSGSTSINVQRTSSTGVACPASTLTNVATACTITVTDTSMGSVTPTGTVNVAASGAGVSPTSTSCALGGSGNNATCNVSFTGTVGGTITLVATYPGSAVHFGSSGGDSITVIKQFTITATAGANGSITPSGPVLVTQGANQTFTISPNSGYLIQDVVVDGSSVGSVGTFTFNNVQADHTISAVFALNAFTITSSAGAGGTIAPNGATSVNSGANQAYTISPNAGFRVLDVVVDGSSVGAVTTYTFTNVTAAHTIAASFRANTKPTADNKSVTTNEDTPASVTLSGSDAETAAGNLTFNVTVAPLHGTLSGTAPNLTYTPAANYSGSDSFKYTVTDRGEPDNCGAPGPLCNAALTSDEATVSITVNAVNDPPTANTQNVSTNEDTPLTISLTGSDADSSALSFSVVSGPTGGSLSAVAAPTCAASGSGTNCSANVTYTPGANFSGNDSFTFKVTDNGTPGLDSTTVTVFISVASVNDAPVAADNTASTNEDAPLDITLSANDVDGTTLTFSIDTSPTHGSLGSITPIGCTPDGSGGVSCTAKVTYTPAGDYSGSDSFKFKVTDGGLFSNAATVSITVAAVNDPPEAMNDNTVSLNEDSSVLITLKAVDIDSTGLNFSIETNPAHGTLSAIDPVSCTPDGLGGAVCTATVTYTPASNYNGPDSFTFKANDSNADSNTATIGITVIPVNDPPTANSQTVYVDEDGSVGITLGANDVDNDTLGYIITGGPSNGVLTGAGASRSYAPNANFNGTDSFTFKVNDGTVDSNVATVTIKVRPLNDAPTADDKTLALDEDTSVGITLTGSDVETASANLTFTVVGGPSHGSLSGSGASLTYTPSPNYNGPDSFTYKVTDRGDPDNCSPGPTCAAAKDSNIATVSITVRPVNDKPTATAFSIAVDEDSTNNPATLSGTDVETASANLTYTVTVNPLHGTLSGTAPNLLYTPAANYNGPDSFKYKVTDRGDPDNCGAPGSGCNAALTSDEVTVTITVKPVNDKPTADSKSVTTAEDNAVGVTLSGSDLETPSAYLTYTITMTPAHGTLSGTAPNLTYTPAANYNGPDSFKYTVTDRGDPDNCGAPTTSCAAAMTSDEATVSITVSPVNDKPVATAFSMTVDEDSTNNLATLSGTDVETSPANLTYTVTVNPLHGALTGTAPNLVYTPTANYNGPDSFKYTVTDRGDPDNCGAPGAGCTAALASDEVTVTITVKPVNDTPAADSKSVTTAEDNAVGVTLSGSDLETPSAYLTYTITVFPSHGTLSGTAPNLTYTPAANYNGSDSFKYTVTDRGDPDNCGAQSGTCAAAKTSSEATVSIGVSPVNDAPVANGQNLATPEDTPLPISLTGSDIDSTSLAFTVVGGPSHGTLSSTSGTMTCTTVGNGTLTDGANCNVSITYSPVLNYNGPDSFTFQVGDGALGSNVATVNINVTPVNDIPSNLTVYISKASIFENDTVTVYGSFFDPDGDPYTVTVNWNDGAPTMATVTAGSTAGVYNYTASHQYKDDNPTGTASDVYPITVTVNDGVPGSTASGGTSVTVANVAPVPGVATGPAGPIQKGSSATITVPFTDVGTLDTHTCSINWDDGGPATAGTVNQAAHTCTGTHAFPDPGVYGVVITITDDDGGSASTTFKYVVVYDPSGGFVTGGGWINSPAGAYKANMSLVGKANFGFVSKYQKGSNVPVGDTEFQFQAGDFNFKSTSYDWLVVSGAKAQYKGVGTVNGVAGYTFLLTAYDGDGGPGNGGTTPDKFRIKVMGNGGGTVYDNNVNGAPDDIDTASPQEIGGGSIVVHK